MSEHLKFNPKVKEYHNYRWMFEGEKEGDRDKEDVREREIERGRER